MSEGPGPDPGGGSSQQLSDLQDQIQRQQVLIPKLKEMLQKNEQSNVTQEKVDKYMNTLSKRSGRKKRDDDGTKKSDLPASQKISLLRQQVEENRVKLAERGKSQKGIEEMVTQLQAQLDDSQSLIGKNPLNLSFPQESTEYSENSSAEDLYNVLLVKEKKITDLLGKVQKLENNVLDLQENVREKDSLIDARTKAITLMTESLSRKRKTTLDELDDTKEQMRKMQQNFIQLEEDMKARQTKLLDDLRQKNYEITDLEELNESLTKKLSMSSEELEILRQENIKVLQGNEEIQTDEMNKLKKQLEESNKNMIKVKAQHKSKIKELTKKIDSFKQITDSNAEIVKLEEENSHLSHKIAELEEEKGSLQLKLMETDTAKSSEGVPTLEELDGCHRELNEKDKIISILEEEISHLKTELAGLSDSEVKSKMTSIDLEEQMESLQNANKNLQSEKETILKTQVELKEKIEQLQKENSEISTKLEHYIQENIELIDKLEKLSAEKVSSAESIEIVEGLTQQEKLELAAYQKNLDLKGSEENLPQGDLNESVNELTEETSDLLQRLELFAVERREVMEKMELLKQENNNLTLKISEVENNRDILAETYEHLQNEKEIVDAKLEQLQSENDTLKKEEKSDLESELKQKLAEFEELHLNLQTQLEQEKQEKSALNNTIIDLNRTLTDLENDNQSLQLKITKLEEEESKLNEIIEKNREEIESISNTEWESRRLVENKDNEISKLRKEKENVENVIGDLQTTIREKEDKYSKIISELKTKYLELQQKLENKSDDIKNITLPLETKIDELTTKNKDQLDKMKKIAANLKKKTQSYQELEEKLKEMQERHSIEVQTSIQQLQDLETEITRLQSERGEDTRVLEEKNIELQNIITELKIKADKSKEMSLEQELLLTRENLGSVESSLQAKIQELEMIVETQEGELVKTRERVAKLEEGISFVEERRASLEKRALDLGTQLEEKQMSCEEISKSEDILEKRLSALVQHDEIIEKKLEEALGENQHLSKQNQELIERNEVLKEKENDLKDKLKILKSKDGVIEDFEQQNANLKAQIETLNLEMKQLEVSYEKIIEDIKNDFDKVNSDWQHQFEEIAIEKQELMAKCDLFAEELKEICEKEIDFNNELIEYKTKLEKSEQEMKSYLEQIELLSRENQELIQLKFDVTEKEEIIKNLSKENEEQKRTILEKDEIILKSKESEAKPQNNLSSFFEPEAQIISESTSQQAVPTFTWSNDQSDPFAFVEQETKENTVQQSPNSEQELLEKIKTLQFMLYNTEKEKEEALIQCEHLTNELTRLIYEKPIENQIIQPQKIQLQEAISGTEETIQSEIESQLVTDSQSSSKDLQKLEFEQTQTPISSAVEPINEELCTAKDSYLCYNENDDGWGCGSDEAKLEEEHVQDLQSFKNRIRVLEGERENHLEEIRQLQVKSGKLIKKLKELKVKNEELVKKKNSDSFFNLDDAIQDELKLQIAKIEKQLKETTVELEKEKVEKASIAKKVDVLTSANERMVEMKEKQDIELRGWQQNCRDLNAKLEKFEWGDDAFVQTTNTNPVSETVASTDSEMAKKIEELNEMIKDLTLDNEELQTLLEEQRRLRLENEKNVVQFKNDTESSIEEKLKLREEINQLIQNNTELQKGFEEIQLQNRDLENLRKDKEEIIAQLSERLNLIENEKTVLIQQKESFGQSQEKSAELELALVEIQNRYKELQNLEGLREETIAQLNQRIAMMEAEKGQAQEALVEINKLTTGNAELEQFCKDMKHQKEELERAKDQVIAQLNDRIKHVEDELEIKIESIRSVEKEKENLVKELQNKNAQIEVFEKSLDNKITTLQEQLELQTKAAETLLEEKQQWEKSIEDKNAEILQVSSAMDQMTQEWNLRIDQRGSDVAESWKLHLESRENEFSQMEQLLRKEILELEEKTNGLVNENNELRKNVDAEIRNEVDRVTALQQQINERQQYINDLTKAVQEKQNEIDSLRLELERSEANLLNEKEIVDSIYEVLNEESERTKDSLVKNIKNKENKLTKLETDLQQTQLILAQLNEEASRTATEIRNLNLTLEDKNQSVANLQRQLEEIQNLKDYEHENTANLQQNLLEYQQQCNNLSNEVQRQNVLIEEKEQEIIQIKLYFEGKDEEIVQLKHLLDEKGQEIVQIKHYLEEKEREHNNTISNLDQELRSIIQDQKLEIDSLKKQLIEGDHHFEEAQLELRLQLEQKTKEFDQLTSDFTQKCEEYDQLLIKLQEQNTLIDEDEKQLTELKAIIEDQVLRIEELKKHIYHKSKDYDSLVAEMDINDSNIKLQQPQSSKEPDLSEPVSRAELDIALYMLHQRDVRCEELTVELTQLLEERDTLQLRLSNVIREKEEMLRQSKHEDALESSTVSEENVDPLTTKLSELKTVGYKKDKTIVDEQELRRIQQLSIMQQHRDEAAKLPPEAAARLVDASYTLSRDVQSPSKVLLNWLWGRSTPKVNNI